MTAAAVDVMVVMPVLFRRRGGTGTHKPTVGQDRDGASSQAPTRSLPPAAAGRASPARPTNHLQGNLVGCRPLIRVRPGGRTSPSNIPAAPDRRVVTPTERTSRRYWSSRHEMMTA